MKKAILALGLALAAVAAGQTVVVRGPTSYGTTVLKSTTGVVRLSDQTNWVFDGDSLTCGFGLAKSACSTSSCQTSLTDATCLDWPSQLVLLSTLNGRVASKHNFATSGNKLADLQARYTASVHPLSPAVTGVPGVLAIWVGANDISTTALATWETNYTTYLTGAKADGWTIMVGTIQRRGDLSDLNGTLEVSRQSWNQFIRASYNAGLFDYLMDVDRLMTSSFDLTTFQTDTIHENAAGDYLIARLANGALWEDGIASPASTNEAPNGSGQGNTNGPDTVKAATTAFQGSFYGWWAGRAITTGNNNSMFGFNAGTMITTGAANSCFGYLSCARFTTTGNNSGFGGGALGLNANGADNVAVGFLSGFNGTAFNRVVFVGKSSGSSNTGNDGVSVGYNSMQTGTGTFNVAVGSGAASGLGTTATQNTIVGGTSGPIVSGDNNACLGYHACLNTTSGTFNVALGAGADIAAGAVTNAIQLGQGSNAASNTIQYGSIRLADSSGTHFATLSTVASLPTCNGAYEGGLRGVTDATAPTYNATLSGSGAVHVLAYCNGTNWVAH